MNCEGKALTVLTLQHTEGKATCRRPLIPVSGWVGLITAWALGHGEYDRAWLEQHVLPWVWFPAGAALPGHWPWSSSRRDLCPEP